MPKFCFPFPPSCCQRSILAVQAMGKGTLSSAEDTDTDVEDRPYNEPLIETRKIEQMMESVYWGDSEDDVKMSKADEKEPETFDSGLDNANLWQCSRFFCKQFYAVVDSYFIAARHLTSQPWSKSSLKISFVQNVGT